jgi:arylsulfatase A-like enzyme
MVRVPLLICFPEPRETRYRFASVEDVFPTLFDYMGVRTEAEIMIGKSLLDYDAARDHVLVGIPRRSTLKRMAIVGGDYKVHFRPFGALEPVEVVSLDDDPVAYPDGDAVRELLARVPNAKSLIVAPVRP